MKLFKILLLLFFSAGSPAFSYEPYTDSEINCNIKGPRHIHMKVVDQCEYGYYITGLVNDIWIPTTDGLITDIGQIKCTYNFEEQYWSDWPDCPNAIQLLPIIENNNGR